MERRKIVIAGGGFGGLFTALYLAQLPWQVLPEIVLLDRHEHFLFSPLLYELLSQELEVWEVAPLFQDLLADTPVHFQQAEVTSLDLRAQQVRGNALTGEFQLDYDVLVLAVGSSPPVQSVTGAREYALPFRSLEDAQRLGSELTNLEQSDRQKIRICVAGGGASGVELACKVSDRLGTRGRVRVVERNSYLLKNSAPANRRSAEVALQNKGIWLDLSASVVAIAPDSITLDYGNSLETLPVDLVLWTVGNGPHPLVKQLGEAGKLPVEPSLQVANYGNVFALGDVAESGQSASAQVAFQQAGYCAKNIWAYWHNEPLVAFTYVPLGEFVSLGVGQASMFTPFLPFGLTGVLPNLLRRAVYLTRMPTLTHQAKVGLHWVSSWWHDLQNQFQEKI